MLLSENLAMPDMSRPAGAVVACNEQRFGLKLGQRSRRLAGNQNTAVLLGALDGVVATVAAGLPGFDQTG